jgi:hypothetical protein
MYSRAIEARLTRMGGTPHPVASGTVSTVPFSDVAENSGCQVNATSGFIRPPRIGYYTMTGFVALDAWAFVAASIYQLTLERWSADGSTPLEILDSDGFYDANGVGDGNRLKVAMTARVNAGERILMRFTQNSGADIDISGGALGVPGGSLSLVYVGDAA